MLKPLLILLKNKKKYRCGTLKYFETSERELAFYLLVSLIFLVYLRYNQDIIKKKPRFMTSYAFS